LYEEKGSKLKDIKDTASDAVEILRELGTQDVQQSLDKAREIAIIVKEIMETLKTPEWQKNLENITLLSQNMNSLSSRLSDTVKEIKETGILEDSQQLIKTAKAKIDSFGGEGGVGGKDLRELSVGVNEMLQSIRGLVDELRTTVAEVKKTRTFSNIQETIKEGSEAYRTIKSASEPERKEATGS
jgi:hypothetical protein